jgi:ectoine hydroxylase
VTKVTVTKDPYWSRTGGASELVRREDPVVWTPGAKGPLTAAQLRSYETDGYLVLPGLLSTAYVEALLVEAERLAGLADRTREDVILEPTSGAVRSLFRVHRESTPYAGLAAGAPFEIARQILGEELYIHQSRINFKPAFEGEPFQWHSDFETWHVEDGMPRMRALSASVLLTTNTEHNGPLLVIPGSHHWYARCAGVTPPENFKSSLRKQELGVPDRAAIETLARERGVASVTGPPGTVVFFDSNIVHGSSGNITPLPRHNVFLVYNEVGNRLVAPFAGTAPRPAFLAEREAVPLVSHG